MSLLAMGTSVHDAGLDVLECAAMPASELERALAQLVGAEGVNGAVVLTTCNRAEAYVDAQTDRMGLDALEALFSWRIGRPLPSGSFRRWRGEGSVNHLFRVACSLDSATLGESQILGQVRTAYERAAAAGSSTEPLDRLFRDALSLGKRVRSETAIGTGTVSLSTTAVKAAFREFPDLAKRSVLVVGSGKMAGLAVEYLRERDVRDIVVTARTDERARELAQSNGARYVPFEQRYRAMADADAVFSATSAPGPVIGAGALGQARTSERKLVIVDEALPRDVEPACASLPGVVLYDIAALDALADEGLATRAAAIGEVERLIGAATADFLAWMQQRTAIPTVRVMYEKGAAVVGREVEKATRELARAQGREPSPEQRAVLDALGTAVMKKILHGPAVRLKKEAVTADSYYYTGAARYLFGIDAFPPGSPPHHREAT